MKIKTRGFTLVEVAISMVFIGILSITLVLLIQNTTAAYQRGMILNQINTVGMDLIDEFRVAVQNSTSDPIARLCEAYYQQDNSSGSNWTKCIKDNANSFIMVTKEAEVEIEGSKSVMPVFGAFCTGTYTYIWNSGYFGQENAAENAIGGMDTRKVNGVSPAVLLGKDGFRKEGFWLLRVYDTERSVCVGAMEQQIGTTGGEAKTKYVTYNDYANDKISNEFHISNTALEMAQAKNEDGTELLKKDGVKNDLVLYDLYIARPALSSTRANMYYAGAFILGTTRGGINVNVAGNNCKPPSDDFSEMEYCAINKFNFAVQAGGA